MSRFIKNLVCKAIGAPLPSQLQPSLNFTPVFFSSNLNLTGEKPECSMLEDTSEIPSKSFQALEMDTHKISAVKPFETPAHLEEAVKSPAVKATENLNRFLAPPESRFQELGKTTESRVAPTESLDQPNLSKTIEFSPVARCETSNLVDTKNPDRNKFAVNFETSTSGWDGKKETEHSTSRETCVQVDHKIPNNQWELKNIPVGVGSEFLMDQEAVEVSQTVEPSIFPPGDNNRVVNIEPSFKSALRTADFITKSNTIVAPSPAVRSDSGTHETQQNKQVRVNIGQIEIKAVQQPASVNKPSARGFDDYLLARAYLDRRYL